MSSTLLTHRPVSRSLGSSDNEFCTLGAAGYAPGSLANIKSLTLRGRMGGPSWKLSSSWWLLGQECGEGTEASWEQLPAHPDCPLEFCLFLERPLSCSAPELSGNHFFFYSLVWSLQQSRNLSSLQMRTLRQEGILCPRWRGKRGSPRDHGSGVCCSLYYTALLHVRFSVSLKSQSQLFWEMGTGLWPAVPKAPSTPSLLCMSLVASPGPLHTTAPLITPAVALALNLLLREKPRGCLRSQVICSQHLSRLASSVIGSLARARA